MIISIAFAIRQYIKSRDATIISSSQHSILTNTENPLNDQNFINSHDNLEFTRISYENEESSKQNATETTIKNMIQQSVTYTKEKMKYKNRKNTQYEAIGEDDDDEEDGNVYSGKYSFEADHKD